VERNLQRPLHEPLPYHLYIGKKREASMARRGANKRGRRVRSALKESEAVNVKIRADLHRKNLIEARDFKKGVPK
jgi:hypothetical protein